MKKLIINLKPEDRFIESEGHIDQKVIWPTYWFFEPVGSDNTPLKFLPKAHRAGFGPNSQLKSMFLTDSSGVCRHKQFRLSVCGLDKFKVLFGCKRDGSDKIEAETYEVWRRLYFSVRTMRPEFLFDFTPVHTEYRKHGIWPEEISPAGGASVRHYPILEKREDGWAMAPRVSQPNLEARFVLVDRLWISAWSRKFVRTGQTSKTITYPHPVWPRGEFIRGIIEGVDVRTLATRSGNSVTLNFGSNPALQARLQSRKIEGSFSVKLLTKVLNGSTEGGPTGRIVIASRTGDGPALRAAGPRQGTMIHEMAHGLKMVARQIQEYNEFNGNPIPSQLFLNPVYYQNGGGHCKTGASGSDPNYVRGTCVMYHAGYDARPLSFCPKCKPIVKRMDMNRRDMPWASS